VRILLAPSTYKNKALQSGGRTHANGMVEILHCGFIPQQRSELASFSHKRAIYSQSRAPGSWRGMTLLPRDIGTCSLCMIKGDDITLSEAMTLLFLTHDVFVVCASMMPEPRCKGHMATVIPLNQWTVCRFLGGKRISDRC
jgi:hypothetical protein